MRPTAETGDKNGRPEQFNNGSAEGLSGDRNRRNAKEPSTDGRMSTSTLRWKQGEWKQATCIGYSEIDRYAIQIYKKHFPEHKEYGNANNIKWSDVPAFELLVGGFPCQAFSIAGKRQGFDDTRGTLFFEIARAIREKQPRLLLLENVKGLLSHDQGRTFGVILNTLDELGYDLQWQVLNSKNFGVPQNRERVFIVGHLRGTSRPEVFPIGEDDGVSRKPNEPDKGRPQAKYSSTLRGSNIKADNTFIIHNVYGGFGEKKNREFHDVSPTIRTPKGGGHIPMVKERAQIRRLTPTECERLQGFPDGWTEGVSDTQRYKVLGNAVTTNVVAAIITKLFSGGG